MSQTTDKTILEFMSKKEGKQYNVTQNTIVLVDRVFLYLMQHNTDTDTFSIKCTKYTNIHMPLRY